MSHIIKKILVRNNIAEVILADYEDDIHSCSVLVRTAFFDIKDIIIGRLNTAKHLNHQGLLDIIDFGVCTNSKPKKYYLSTRYLPGVTLSQVLSRFELLNRKIPISLILHIMTSLCASLEYIHEFNGSKEKDMLYHGGICPDSVYITYDGEVYFTDAGIADIMKYRYTGNNIIENGRSVYLHPDILMGSAVKRYHEIYSMGILLFRMFIEEKSFTRFFEGNGIQKLKAVKQFLPSIPDAVDKIIASATRFRGLGKFTKYENVADLFHDVLDYTNIEPVKYNKDLTSLIIYALFPESTEISSEKQAVLMKRAVEYTKNGNDRSMKQLLSERLNDNKEVCTYFEASQNQRIQTTQKTVLNISTPNGNTFSNNQNEANVKSENVQDDFNGQKHKIRWPHPVTFSKNISEENNNVFKPKISKTSNIPVSEISPETMSRPPKVMLPEKTVQAFSRIIKTSQIIDAQIIEIPELSSKIVKEQGANNLNVQTERNPSTLDSFSVLKQKNGRVNSDKILGTFSNILKKESVSS